MSLRISQFMKTLIFILDEHEDVSDTRPSRKREHAVSGGAAPGAPEVWYKRVFILGY